ncbi:Lipolytic enzyme [Mycena chlorophos]|uniref:Lipolytic enzyme n=1 Tax=Mycena chlorophos TaxID=658473 RepID=A0A8H6RXT8_MYCCL|nr:Lipolytic enzyme [Mycena chlorophos]
MRSFLPLALAALPSAYAGFSGQSLRIMPLGASITFGYGSTDGNGYRGTLHDLLAADGNTVQMVGTQINGTSVAPWNEGYPGYIITQVNTQANLNVPIQNPNIVTLLVGTNDATGDVDPAGMASRLTTLIQNVLDAPPTTLVVVSTLPPNANTAANGYIKTYNSQIPGVVANFVAAGRSVVFADTGAQVSLSDLVDGTHPNDAAYARMAGVFYDAIQAAYANGWIWPLDGANPQDGFTGKALRIMATGASITYGSGSTDGNGYRLDLLNLLKADGNTVDMVGSQQSGTMADNYNEGYPGYTIAQVTARATIEMPLQNPNIVTLLVGTVDMLNDDDPAGAPARLTTLIQTILDAPATTLVVVSNLLPNADAATNTRINAFNGALPGVVASFVSAGRSVVLVDCHGVVNVTDLVDGTNPDDAGYARMAQVWYNGIQIANTYDGWIWPLYGTAQNGRRDSGNSRVFANKLS